jgi:hypothetical protein
MVRWGKEEGFLRIGSSAVGKRGCLLRETETCYSRHERGWEKEVFSFIE